MDIRDTKRLYGVRKAKSPCRGQAYFLQKSLKQSRSLL